MVRALLTRWRRFVECWRLARLIQRGDLVGVHPDRYAALVAAPIAAPPPPTPPAPPAPEVVPAPAFAGLETSIPDDPEGRYELILTRPNGTSKRILRTNDARRALREWKAYPARPGYPLSYYDHELQASRGIR